MLVEQIKVGKDLRIFVLELLVGELELKKRKLITYLLALWASAERYQYAEEVTFSLIGKIIEDAFHISPKKVNWENLVKNPITKPYESEANSPEYFEEIKKYKYFQNVIRNYVVDLKKQELWWPKYKSDWENLGMAAFMERGTWHLEPEDEYDDNVSWFDLAAILNSGRYTE